MKLALGFIETYGYVGAIEAADACLKAANVQLVSCCYAGSGLVTITIEGDVGAVKAAIDTGATAAEGVGQLVGINVIARPSYALDKIVKEQPKVASDGNKKHVSKNRSNPTNTHKGQTGGLANLEDSRDNRENNPSAPKYVYHNEQEIPLNSIEVFTSMKVVELRRIARRIEGISIPKNQIKYAKKDQLLQAIKNVIEEVD